MKIVKSGGRVITLSKEGICIPCNDSKLQDILSSFEHEMEIAKASEDSTQKCKRIVTALAGVNPVGSQ